jgi:hypothetical protein
MTTAVGNRGEAGDNGQARYLRHALRYLAAAVTLTLAACLVAPMS